MQRRCATGLRGLAIVAGLFLVTRLAAAEPKTDGHGYVDLFDGKSLDGWIQRGGKAKYTVADGQIVGTAVPNTPNSFLCTQRDFGDFILELEFKVDPTLNSGVQVRSHFAEEGKEVKSAGKTIKGGPGGRVFGYQVEIDPSDRAYTGGIYDEGRRAWLQDLKENEPARKAFKAKEWNTLKIECKGPAIKTWVNGVAAADLKDDVDATGFIALQVHGIGKKTDPLEVRWRKIRLKELK
jgi:3-keto-disaccharide hydrolase